MSLKSKNQVVTEPGILDIRSIDGKEIFKWLIKTADIVVESFSPSYMEKLGLGYHELESINPGIILASITPFGQTGPYKDYQASELSCWAMGGLLHTIGEPDMPPVHVSHIPIAFLIAAMDAAWACAIAVYWRANSGEGQYIDVSIQESMLKAESGRYHNYLLTGQKFIRGGALRSPVSGVIVRGTWEAKDGYITFLIFPGQWGATHDNPPMVEWMDEEGMADDFIKGINWAKLDWGEISVEEADRIQDYFARFFRMKTKAELLEGALKRRLIIQPIYTPTDILSHSQLKARDYWQELEYPELGTTVSYPSRFCLPSETPCKHYRRAPHIGEHNQEIFEHELGLPHTEIIALKEAGVI
jgi:crotonobetainyl-CoA:carnitine CoA-transferase CaiB-like acyl-CoA transferase